MRIFKVISFDHLLAALPMFELAAFQIISDTNKQLPQA